jgi:hypothetical protein
MDSTYNTIVKISSVMPKSVDRWHGRGGGGGIGGKTTGTGGQQPYNSGPGWLYPLCPLLYCKVPTYDTIPVVFLKSKVRIKTKWPNFTEENQLLGLVYQTASLPLWKLFFKILESAIKNILEMDHTVLKLRNNLTNSHKLSSSCPVL